MNTSPIWLSNFDPPALGPDLWGPQGASYDPTHSTGIDPWPRSAGVPFMRKVQIPKFLLLGWPARPFGPIFSGWGPKFKFVLRNILLPCCLNSKKVWHYPLPSKPWEEIDLAETPFLGVRAWPCVPRGLIHPPKNYLRAFGRPWKFWADPSPGSRVMALFLQHRHIDAQTFPNDAPTIKEIFFAQTLQNSYHFTTSSSLRFVKDKPNSW